MPLDYICPPPPIYPFLIFGKQCSDMPSTCSSLPSGVVIHEDRIKVITEIRCLMYPDDTDTWTDKQYDKLGNKILEVDGNVQQGRAFIHTVHV